MSRLKRLPLLALLSVVLFSCGGEKEETPVEKEQEKEEQIGPFISDYRLALDSARASGKPLLVYFSGYSCTGCRTFEEVVLRDPEVSKMIPDFVIVQLMVDEKEELPGSIQRALDTSNVDSIYGRPIETTGDLWSAFQVLNFDTLAQPFTVALSDCEQWLADPLSGDIDVDRMVTFLTQVQGNYPIDTSMQHLDSMNVIMYHPGFEYYWYDKPDQIETDEPAEVEKVEDGGTDIEKTGDDDEGEASANVETDVETDDETTDTRPVPAVPTVRAEHVTWYLTVKKVSDDTYDLHYTATLEKGWHTYSVYQDPITGPVPTSFEYEKTDKFELVGRTGDKLSKTKYVDLWGTDVKYFDSRAEFRQRIRTKAEKPFNVKATVNYMLCDDSQCLPPRDLNFTFLVDPTN